MLLYKLVNHNPVQSIGPLAAKVIDADHKGTGFALVLLFMPEPATLGKDTPVSNR